MSVKYNLNNVRCEISRHFRCKKIGNIRNVELINLKQTGRTRILVTCTEAENNLKKVASLQLNKGQLACRFPQFSEQVDKSLLSVTECTRD